MPITTLGCGSGGGGGTLTEIITTTPAVLTITNPTGPITTIDSTSGSGDVKQLGAFGTAGKMPKYTSNAVDPEIEESTLTEAGLTAVSAQTFTNASDLTDIFSFLDPALPNMILQKQPAPAYWQGTHEVQLGENSTQNNEGIAIGKNTSSLGLGNSINIGENSAITDGILLSSANSVARLDAATDEILLSTPNRNISLTETQYIGINAVINRFEGSIFARWLPNNIATPFAINLPNAVNVDLPIAPNITNTGADPLFNTVVSGVQYIGTDPLSANIHITINGGRQDPNSLWVEVGVKVNLAIGGISSGMPVSRFQSNGVGVGSTLTLYTRQTVLTGDIISIYLRQHGSVGTFQYNYSDCLLLVT